MVFSLDNIVLWGRSFDEYVAMFYISDNDLEKSILGVGDGPAAFNAYLTRRGGRAISTDPIYRFSAEKIRSRIDNSYHEVMEQISENAGDFVWKHITSIEELGQVRMKAMLDFLDDYPDGLREGRYIASELPALPFKDQSFDIALCSHLLFLYSDGLSSDLHFHSIMELCRVAKETRIFPLVELGLKKSRHLDLVMARLKDCGFEAIVENVPYEFQKGGDQMLKITAPCKLGKKTGTMKT